TLDEGANGIDKTTVYEYGPGAVPGSSAGAGTQETKRTTWQGTNIGGAGSTKLSESTYIYNLQGRLQSATVYDGSSTATTTFEYNDSGIRVSQSIGGQKTIYVVDAQNPTGYTQVIEEGVDSNANGVLSDVEIKKAYGIGLDVISQAVSAAAAQFLLYDGHGST